MYSCQGLLRPPWGSPGVTPRKAQELAAQSFNGTLWYRNLWSVCLPPVQPLICNPVQRLGPRPGPNKLCIWWLPYPHQPPSCPTPRLWALTSPQVSLECNPAHLSGLSTSTSSIPVLFSIPSLEAHSKENKWGEVLHKTPFKADRHLTCYPLQRVRFYNALGMLSAQSFLHSIDLDPHFFLHGELPPHLLPSSTCPHMVS